MKRLPIIVLTLALCLLTAGCGAKPNEPDDGDSAKAEIVERMACDADELVLEPIRSACGSLPVEEGYTMAQLGRACGIAVGAAVVTVLN